MSGPEILSAGTPARRRLGAIHLWLMFVASGAFNILLVAVFLYFSGFLGQPRFAGGLVAATGAGTDGEAKMEPRLDHGKSDFVADVIPSIETRSLKRSLNRTLIAYSPDGDDSDAPEAFQDDPAPLASDMASQEFYNEAPEETNTLAVPPMLRRSSTGSAIEITRFKTINMADGASECIGLARDMLKGVGASEQLLHIVAQSDIITIARICAANGSVVMTCRGNAVTVSPRKQRPDDNCGKAG